MTTMLHTARKAVAVALTCFAAAPGTIQQPQQNTFPSAEQAVEALVAAARADDAARLLELLGPAGRQLISSGDSLQDKRDRDQFVRKYSEMHRFSKEPDGTTMLYIGAENWPLPIPLVEQGGAWRWDTDAGKQEILFRRIGRNELAAIRACRALVEAEQRYYGSAMHYTTKFVSDSGTRNGLYWRDATNEQRSPIGPLLAAAAGSAATTPFHGYFYRLLTAQGPHAPGGAKSYRVNSALTGGFAFLAYPAEYRSSGVMTFLVNQDGIVYQKDLGSSTAELAAALSAYDPDSTWQQAE